MDCHFHSDKLLIRLKTSEWETAWESSPDDREMHVNKMATCFAFPESWLQTRGIWAERYSRPWLPCITRCHFDCGMAPNTMLEY